jgi:hypothetical protein
VGNFFGAVFNNIFVSSQPTIPALYLYHQPNDLIVPYGYSRVFGGYAHCASQFPFSCQNIINRPHVYGSHAIKMMIDDMVANQVAAPDYQFDHTNNSSPCAIQIANPSQAGHAIDNYWLRTSNMAAFFAGKIDGCAAMNIGDDLGKEPLFAMGPNPISTQGFLHIQTDFKSGDMLKIYDVRGMKLWEREIEIQKQELQLDLSTLGLPPGLYLFQVLTQHVTLTQKLKVEE